MKFFTLDYYRAGYTADTFAAAVEAYNRHLAALRGTVSDELLVLAKLLGVDDGLVIEVRRDRSLETLQLTMRCGDVQMGYYDLVLRYEGIALPAQTELTLARIARTTRDDGRHDHDVAYHEVDRTETGGVEHSLLFHPGVVINLRCRSLCWEKIDRPDRQLPLLPDRFPGGPTWVCYRSRKRRLRAAPQRR